MRFPSATVVAAIALTWIFSTSPPLAARTATAIPTRGAPGSAVASTKLAAGLWAPKKSAKPRPSREDDDAREEELLKPRNPTTGGGGGGTAPAKKRRPIKMDDTASEEGDDEAEEGGDDEDEDKPKVV